MKLDHFSLSKWPSNNWPCLFEAIDGPINHFLTGVSNTRNLSAVAS
jgi:hypothetical protein